MLSSTGMISTQLQEVFNLFPQLFQEEHPSEMNSISSASNLLDRSFTNPIANQGFSNSSNNPKNSNKITPKKKRTRRRQRSKKEDLIDEFKVRSPSIALNNTGDDLVQTQIKIPSADKLEYSTNEKTNKNHVKKQQLSNVEFTFTIHPIFHSKTGRFIRRRSSRYKYINLKMFISSPHNLPCIFTTKTQLIAEMVSNIKTITLGQNYVTKMHRKKLPKIKERKKKAPKEINKKGIDIPFPNLMSLEEVEIGLANGTLITGFIRINPKKIQDAYVSHEDTTKADYYLTSLIDRNRTLEGDNVVLKIKPEKEWVHHHQTAQVVYIRQEVHPRIFIGYLKPRKKNHDYALLYPRDKRCPILRIPESNWPNSFKENPEQFESILFVGKIVTWTVIGYAIGILIENLGTDGDLKVETISILRSYNLDITPFPENIQEYLPTSDDILEEELIYRVDIRNECVFTIDPSTAKDLDDAVSVKPLSNGAYEVGVHIADVAHFLEEGTELDQIVSKKATTIYLIDQVFHMLPVKLCLFCSLLPSQDKLSFSVFLEITSDGEVINKRFARSIMNSCTKLAYEHAQEVIMNPEKEFTLEDFPPIYNGFTPKDIAERVKMLYSLAKKLREKRVQSGALRIDQVKLAFCLDPQTGEPLEFSRYEIKEAHNMIEEFMLLANVTVAEKIAKDFPGIAFLRRHEQPTQREMNDFRSKLSEIGIHIDTSSSGGISRSLQKYMTSDYAGICRAAVLNHLAAKVMKMATYICASNRDYDFYKHYALNIPIYTHFTSPIRRYADIMVHRLLAASLNYCESPEWDTNYVSAIANNCNIKKKLAKRAGDDSSELFLSYYIEKHQPFEQDCVVVDVKDRSFDVIALKTGSVLRIYQNSCEEGTQWRAESIRSDTSKGEKPIKLILIFPETDHFPKTELLVEMFTSVKVNLKKSRNSYKLEGILLRPLPAQVFTRQQQ